jgi:copper chaperone NosL
MGVSDARLAAQLVAALEEPKLFDDIGCLRDYLKAGETIPADAIAYVADHRTGAWVPARQAVYVQTPALATPMGSGIAAWSDASSRSADRGVPDASARSAADLFGPAGPPGGGR